MSRKKTKEMPGEVIIDMLSEVNEDALVCDGLEDAIIGIGESFGKSPVAIYDIDRIIGIYIKRDGMTEEEAREFFDYNVLGAYAGEHMPVFVTLYK